MSRFPFRPRLHMFFIFCLCAVFVATVSVGARRGSTHGLLLTTPDKGVVTPAGTITVNSLSDVANAADGLCTLREAITAANTDTASGVTLGECAAGSGDDTISFSVTGTIDIAVVPDVLSNMLINGPGANLLTVELHYPGSRLNVSVASPGLVTISGLTIQSGSSQEGGGAIIKHNTGTLTVTNSTLNNNRAPGGFGAGLYNDGAGIVTLMNCTLSNNRALNGGAGGAIANRGTGTVNIINSTLSGNTSTSGGGGIYSSSGTINVINSTITNNDDGLAGGIYTSGGIVRIRNTIIAGNIGGSSSPELNGVMNSQGHNFIGRSVAGNGFTNGANGDVVGTVAAPINPSLGPLANNGGPTQTHALLVGSPAIDAGDNCVAQPAHCGDATSQLTTDQRGTGFPRVVNSTVDIGAFESPGFSGYTTTVTSGTPQNAAIGNSFAAPLVVTVTSPGGEPVVGGTVTFTAPASGPSAVFTGGVRTFYALINASNQASVTATANATAGGPYNVIAGVNSGSNTVNFSLTNNRPIPAIAVSSSVNPSDPGQSVIFTAAVSSPFGAPTGTAQFKDNGVNIGGPVTVSGGGFAQQITSSLTSGTHTITAEYNGDSNFQANTGTLSGGQVVRNQTLSINDVSIMEGDAGTSIMSFTVTLSPASSQTVQVDYATANGTATAPSDYVAITPKTLIFDPGANSKTVQVNINGDQTFEPNETLLVNLSGPINASIGKAQGTGTITNDDAQGGIINFSLSNYNVSEGSGSIAITVNRSGDVSSPATVDYATDDTGAPIGCSVSNGKASSRCDFTTAAGTLKFAPGDTTKTFNVLVSQDAYLEGGSETLGLVLTNPTGGAVFGVPSTATVTILDDTQGPSNPIDDTQYFVRQHYHDFLNREPDPSGWAFWINQITSCGSNAQCIEARRVDVSASFFLSIEFQQSGYLVERFYKSAYGNTTGTSTLGGAHQLAVPIVRLNEFLKDTQRLGQGVVVLQPGWEQALENNKQAYALEFVQTSRFIAAYPTTLTPAEFVDRLDFFAGNPLSPSERQTAINLFGGAANSSNVTARAQAIRQVAEDTTLYNAEFNRAFVLAEYFGYLRRNPNDAPEADYTGYDFWLTKLNQFNGNYINAEMVKAFLSSVEYRQRFGP